MWSFPVDSYREPTGNVPCLVLSNGSLTIEETIPADEGVYQCVVHVTPHASHVTWTYLSRRSVLSLPSLQRFEHQPTNRKAYLGQFVAFRCILEFRPSAEIEWYHNDRRIHESNGYSFVPLSHTLTISNINHKHAGNYKCIARNGNKERTSQVAHLDVSDGDNGAISFALEPRGQVITSGESFILECLVNGHPKPRVRWLHASSPVVEDGSHIKRVGADRTSLLIEKSGSQDGGVYTCRAENGDDSIDASATISIRIPPTITALPKEQVMQETTDVEFECKTIGDPQPRVTWYKNGETIIPSEYFMITDTKLKVLGLVKDDQGIYQCIADNDAGSVQAGAQLVVDAAASHLALTAASSTGVPKTPLQPLGLRVMKNDSRSIVLKWDPPVQTHGDILLYHVYFREDDSTRERVINSTSTSATLSSLQPNTTYIIRVVGENRAGQGKSSDELQVTTSKEQAVPGKVRNLRAHVLGSQTIQVEWDPPSLSGPDAIRYKLFYLKSNADKDEEETQVFMVKTSYTLHGMEKNTEYKIRVEAEGQNGAGLSSDTLNVRTLTDVPSSAPQNVRIENTQASSISLTWQPPSEDEQNGFITGYKIKYKTKKRGSKGNIVVVDGDPGKYTLHGLEAGMGYTIRVAAINQNGTGPFSEWVEAETPNDDLEENQVLGAPLALNVKPGPDSIHVTWEPPHHEGIMIRGYQIGWGLGVPDGETARVDPSTRTYTIKGLKPNREYVVSLRAFNNVGTGFPIYETVRTAPYQNRGSFSGSSFGNRNQNQGGSATTPIGVQAETISANDIRVHWTDPSELFNPSYTIRYSASGESVGQARFVNTSENEYFVKGLRPNTIYEFAVKLAESNIWSMTATNRTEPAPPSSAPRDLTIVPPSLTSHEDPNTITLNWQPPKYANGDIQEYLVFYTENQNADEKEWLMDSVKGDRLSIVIKSLLPRTIYYFKVQARNIKGYGPMSNPVTHDPGNAFGRANMPVVDGSEKDRSGFPKEQIMEIINSNLVYVIVGGVSFIVLFLVIILSIVCIQRSSSANKQRRRSQQGYIPGRKTSGRNGKNQPDLWIQNGQVGRGADYLETPGASLHDLKRLTGQVVVDSPPPRYQTLHQETCMSQSHPSPHSPPLITQRQLHRQSLPSALALSTRRVNLLCPSDESDSAIMTSSTATTTFMNSSLESAGLGTQPPPTILAAKRANTVILGKSNLIYANGGVPGRHGSSSAYHSDVESNGTLSRSYHQSSASLEGRQRTPQVIYTGSNRQPIAKIDFAHNSEHGSSYGGSSTALQGTGHTPPPTLPNQGPPHGIPPNLDGYRTLRGSNPLRSFAQLGGAPPSVSPTTNIGSNSPNMSGERTAHIVRPVVVASPTTRTTISGGKPAGIVIGQKVMGAGKLPIGRAAAQPRVNVANVYSPYSSVRVTSHGEDLGSGSHDEETDLSNKYEHPDSGRNEELKPLRPAPSTEDFSMNDIDNMIDTLQQLQQEFTERS
uniref:Neogenin n=1 Tax=Acrobeloides nanus TaxID=290746 RepID=A0A914DYB5_9BILA